MAENKTRATKASVDAYLAAIGDEARRQDCEALVALMRQVTTYDPVMWGSSIVGFGSYHYRYDSGHEGDACLVGLSSRKVDISIYLMAGFAGQDELLARLGKHRMGKACLYVRRLSDIDVGVLRALVAGSVAEMNRLHG